MKISKKALFAAALLFLIAPIFAQKTQNSLTPSLPFSKGVNLLKWFEVWEEWNKDELPALNKYDEDDFACLKDIGVDIVRVPIHFDLLMKPHYTGKILDVVLQKLDQVCEWAEKYQIYLVIDNHSFNSTAQYYNPPSIAEYQKSIEAVWSQLAQRYKNRSQYIIYEIVNEPNGQQEYMDNWLRVQEEIINLIRSYDAERTIVVSSPYWTGLDELLAMKPYKDPNLLYTIHFYEPLLFTHQGSNWMAGAEDFADIRIPFPYEKSRLPKYKDQTMTWNQLKKQASKLTGSWMKDAISTYPTEGTEKYVKARIKKVADWAKKNKVRVFAGEMGAMDTADRADRIAWLNLVRTAFEENNMPYCVWGIDGGSGFLKSQSSQNFPEDIDQEILEAEGFTMPDQAALAKASRTLNEFPQKSYIVYDGVVGKKTVIDIVNCRQAVWDEQKQSHCMQIPHVSSQSLLCKFILPEPVASKVTEQHDSITLSFSVKFTDKSQSFNVFLQDTDEGEANLPWKKGYTVSAADYTLNKWVKITIPLSAFKNSWGTWSDKEGKNYNEESKFEWSRFQKLYFDFEDWDDSMRGDIYIDDIILGIL